MKKYAWLLLAVFLVLAPQAFATGKVLRITNHRDLFPIMYVYITPAGRNSWGVDQLGGKTIAAGDSRSWTIPWRGCYIDVQAKTFTGLTAERRNLNVCGGFEWTIYDDNPKAAPQQDIAATAPNGTMIWNIRDNCNNKEAIGVRFFTDNNDLYWPSNGYFYTKSLGALHVQKLSCPVGRMICYGAWQAEHNLTWGAGRYGTDACTNCCSTCDGNVYEVSLSCN